MAQWNYKLTKGKALREAIQNGNRVDVLDRLADCWREINKAMPDFYEEDELEDDLGEIRIAAEDIYSEYVGEDDVEDRIDFLLSEFYDFCDNCRIWVEL